MELDPVLVSIVTYNDEAFLEGCLESLRSQTVPLKVKLFDNASEDATREIACRLGCELFASATNQGFSKGHNYNLLSADFVYALLLNADVVLQPDYVERSLRALAEIEGAGMSGGKLYRMDSDSQQVFRSGAPILDTTGIYFTPSQRHFDRGSNEKDRGQYGHRQLVFGISGAALMCSQEMLEDVRIGEEYLDEDFFAYREDADLAWRAQLSGWKAVYEPRAKGLHARRVLPSNRRSLPALINYHSLKNRYLMRIKNLDPAVQRRCFPYMWLRDLGILFYALILERDSLRSYGEVWRLRKKLRQKREWIRQRRRVDGDYLAKWFSFKPVAVDLPVTDIKTAEPTVAEPSSR